MTAGAAGHAVAPGPMNGSGASIVTAIGLDAGEHRLPIAASILPRRPA